MIPSDYINELEKGYFNENGVIKKVFVKTEKAVGMLLDGETDKAMNEFN